MSLHVFSDRLRRHGPTLVVFFWPPGFPHARHQPFEANNEDDPRNHSPKDQRRRTWGELCVQKFHGGIFSFSELKRKTLVKFFLFFCERSSTLEFYSYIRFIFKRGLKLHSLKVALALRKPSPKRKENVFQALPLGCPPPCD